MGRFPLIHAFGAALINDAFAVAHDDIGVRHAHRLYQLGARNRRCTSAVANDLHILQFTPRQPAGVDQTCRSYDRGAMLVIVKHGDIHAFAQGLFNQEAIRRGNVLQIDPAETRLQQFDRIDKTLRIFGLHFDINRIDIGEAFEQHCLALHHRL